MMRRKICCETNIASLASQVPFLYLWTFTFPWSHDPRSAREKIKKLIDWLTKNGISGVRVYEKHESGDIHVHAVLDTWLWHPEIQARCHKWGFGIVWVEKILKADIDGQNYCAKHLAKASQAGDWYNARVYGRFGRAWQKNKSVRFNLVNDPTARKWASITKRQIGGWEIRGATDERSREYIKRAWKYSRKITHRTVKRERYVENYRVVDIRFETEWTLGQKALLQECRQYVLDNVKRLPVREALKLGTLVASEARRRWLWTGGDVNGNVKTRNRSACDLLAHAFGQGHSQDRRKKGAAVRQSVALLLLGRRGTGHPESECARVSRGWSTARHDEGCQSYVQT